MVPKGNIMFTMIIFLKAFIT